MIVLPVGENRMIVASFVSTQYQRVTDGGTDGGTDPTVAYTAVSIASYADATVTRLPFSRRHTAGKQDTQGCVYYGTPYSF